MKNTYITDDDMKQVFLSCSMKEPEGMYADDVDLFEFTDAVIKAVRDTIAREEKAKCVKFVNSLNTFVATKLNEWQSGV